MKKDPPPPPETPDLYQQDLFDLPIDRPAQPFDTSEAAAESMADSAESLRTQVLLAIWKHRGLTVDEVEAMTGLRHQTAGPRFWELERRSLIYKSVERRITRSGRRAIVYHVTPRGATLAKQLSTKV